MNTSINRRWIWVLAAGLTLFAPALTVGQPIEFVAENTGGPSFHIVKKGETLYGIARTYKTTINELTALNKISSANIYPGQRLMVPANSNQPVAEPAPEMASARTRSMTPNTNTEESTYSQMSSLDALGNPAPAANAKMASPQNQASSLKIEKKEFALVQSGENIYTLANLHGVQVEQLREWNGVTEVRPGDVVIVRKWYEQVASNELDRPVPEATMAATRGLSSRPDPAAAYTTPVYTPSNSGAANARMATPAQTTRSVTNTQQAVAQPEAARTYAPAYTRPETYNTQTAWMGGQVEQGPYDVFEFDKAEDLRFYAVHKSLAPGTKVKLDIPNNSGYVEVMIVGKLSDASRAFIGLSPSCIALLEGAGAKGMATIFYE